MFAIQIPTLGGLSAAGVKKPMIISYQFWQVTGDQALVKPVQVDSREIEDLKCDKNKTG